MGSGYMGTPSWEKTDTNDSITFLHYAAGGNKKAAFHSTTNHLLGNRPGGGDGVLQLNKFERSEAGGGGHHMGILSPLEHRRKQHIQVVIIQINIQEPVTICFKSPSNTSFKL